MSAGASPIRRTTLAAAGANLAVDATAAEVISRLRDAGIRSILLKGPSIGRWLYPPESTRVSVDVDLLVAPVDRGEAERVLASLGFRAFPTNVAGREIKHAYCWQRDLNPITVDLHLTLAGIGASDEDAWRFLSKETEQLLVGGLTVEVLSQAGRAMHVALHAAQHGSGFIGPVTDLERAVEQVPLDVWRKASALAIRLDGASLFVAGLSLLEGGRQILSSLGLSEPKTVEVAPARQYPAGSRSRSSSARRHPWDVGKGRVHRTEGRSASGLDAQLCAAGRTRAVRPLGGVRCAPVLAASTGRARCSRMAAGSQGGALIASRRPPRP